MNTDLSRFAARLREGIAAGFQNQDFDALAMELFYLQYSNCVFYKNVCQRRRIEPAAISVLRQTTPTSARWKQIPFVPTSVFKALGFSCIPDGERIASFHSSGTTGQTPSRHFHNVESLTVYETSLWHWFRPHFRDAEELLFLTPTAKAAPNSSLVHMFETVREKVGQPESAFVGRAAADGSWTIEFEPTIQKFKSACAAEKPLTVLGTAFSFVHLLDFLAENNLRFELPTGSRVMETGGYKNRSRTMPKRDLHALITNRLGVLPENIVCEYGMSELSSQAYDVTSDERQVTRGVDASRITHHASRIFHFPPWTRVQIISPETGREIAEGETGLIRVFDLANVFSVAAIQTEDLGVRRGEGFELVGRAPSAEPRGCSLNSPESLNN